MPHVPRRPTATGRLASTLGPRPELLGRVRAAESARAGTKVGLTRISLHSYEPDQAKLREQMLGKEVSIDPHTGNLVSRRN